MEATSSYILQVSDRLVSYISSGRPYDETSNKTLLYRARDAFVTMSYTGIAYLAGVPTDQWIAEKIWGEPFFRDPEGKLMAFGNPLIPRWRDFGPTLHDLKYQMQLTWADLSSQYRAFPFELLVGGWQIKGKRLRPLLVTISKSKGSEFKITNTRPRYWYLPTRSKGNGPDVTVGKRLKDIEAKTVKPVLWTRPTKLAITGEPLTDIEEEIIRSNMRHSYPSPKLRVEKIEQAITEVIQRVAVRVPTVGSDCLSVLIPRLDLAPPRVRYINSGSQGEQADQLASFSPWIIGPNGYSTPSVIVGTFEVRYGDITVVVEGPQRVRSRVAQFQAQKRRPPPAQKN